MGHSAIVLLLKALYEIQSKLGHIHKWVRKNNSTIIHPPLAWDCLWSRVLETPVVTAPERDRRTCTVLNSRGVMFVWSWSGTGLCYFVFLKTSNTHPSYLTTLNSLGEKSINKGAAPVIAPGLTLAKSLLMMQGLHLRWSGVKKCKSHDSTRCIAAMQLFAMFSSQCYHGP